MSCGCKDWNSAPDLTSDGRRFVLGAGGEKKVVERMLEKSSTRRRRGLDCI